MAAPRRPLALALGVAFLLAASLVRLAAAPDLPTHLSDDEFWRLSSQLSEENGWFQSDNLLSNEIVFSRMVPEVVAKTTPGGVYLGVGPEQNFTYIAAMRPGIAFITDVRRGNLHLQLMYKALFDLSADRAEFVSRLFTKKRPAGLTATSSVNEIMNAYWDAYSSDETAYKTNLQAIDDDLTKTHGLPLSTDDLDGIAKVYRAFYWYGPAMNYSAGTNLDLSHAGKDGPMYWDLMVQADATGQGLSYLGTEEKFTVMKDLERRNLLVPVVGNFAGPKALRAVGAWVREHGATVGAFYLSNVEGYLRRDGLWNAFCGNVASMPLTDQSMFIRPAAPGSVAAQYTLNSSATTLSNRLNTVGTNGITIVRFVTPSGVNSLGPLPPGMGLVPIKEEVKSCGGGV